MPRELPLQPGRYKYAVEPIIENAGPTPTKELTLVTCYELRSTAFPDDYAFALIAEPKGCFIGPKGTLIAIGGGELTDDELTEIQRGERFFCVWGRAEYRDGFPDTPIHAAEFCREINAIAGNPRDPKTMRTYFFVRPNRNSAD